MKHGMGSENGKRSGAFLAVVLASSLHAVGCGNISSDGDLIQSRSSPLLTGSINVLTRSYNAARTGTNTSETVLTQANINPTHFGRLFQVGVDDQVYAQVLYASAVGIAGGTHNVMYVATANNSVYAFDADNGALLWSRNFNGGFRPPRNSEVGQSPCGGGTNYQDFAGDIGIIGTPVIDGGSSTMYFVTRTLENGTNVQRFRAIDVSTGNERSGSGAAITLTGFDPLIHNQRAALALGSNAVYVAWAAFCDSGSYHGWVMAFDKTSLARIGSFNSTPNGVGGGIWQGGAGPAVDPAGNVYVTTGNSTNGSSDLGESIIKLAPRTLARRAFFKDPNFVTLNGADLDLASAGPTLIPGTNFIVNGGKQGIVYRVDFTTASPVAKSIQATDLNVRPGTTHHMHGSSVFWTGPQGKTLFVWGENDFVRAYRFDTGTNTFNQTPVAVGQELPAFGMPGGMLSLSANGAAAGTGVLWAVTPLMGNGNHSTVPGLLRAYNAETLALLWDSSAVGDDMLTVAKFNPPVVANGKVYVASFGGTAADGGLVSVYGLLTPPSPVTSGRVVNLRKRHGDLPGICIDVPGSTANQTPLQIWTCNGTGAQTWQLNDKGGGTFEVRRGATDLCMDIPNDQVFQGAQVQQYPCNGTQAQTFAIEAMPAGVQVRVAGTGFCVDVPNNSSASGTLLQLWPCNGTDAQVFTALPPQIKKSNFVGGDIVEDGQVSCLDTPGADLSAGTGIQIWICNLTGAQDWQYNDKGDGTWEIRRNTTGLCLDVPGGDAFQGQRVQQWPCNGTPAQIWNVEGVGAGSQIRFSGTNFCVDVPNNSNVAGTFLQLWPCNGTGAQIFGLI